MDDAMFQRMITDRLDDHQRKIAANEQTLTNHLTECTQRHKQIAEKLDTGAIERKEFRNEVRTEHQAIRADISNRDKQIYQLLWKAMFFLVATQAAALAYYLARFGVPGN